MTEADQLPKAEKNDTDDDFLKHPFFAKDFETMKDHPATEALIALKYETENPNANADSYKDEGNHYVTQKDYVKAVTAYSGGIKVKPTDTRLLAVLYTNRAIANGLMKNHGSCVKDCKQAIKLLPEHLKAYIQAAKSLIILGKHRNAVEMCEAGLRMSPDHDTLTELKVKAEKLEKTAMEEESKQMAAARQDCGNLRNIIKQLISRGIQVNMDLPPIGIPESAGVAISFDRVNKIHWPVLVMYPESNQTDFIQDAAEFLTIEHCLKQLLDVSTPLPWDKTNAYTTSLDELEIYYEDVTVAKQMVPIPISMTITELTKTSGFFVRRDLVIVLLVVSKLSKNFHKTWLANLRG